MELKDKERIILRRLYLDRRELSFAFELSKGSLNIGILI